MSKKAFTIEYQPVSSQRAIVGEVQLVDWIREQLAKSSPVDVVGNKEIQVVVEVLES